MYAQLTFDVIVGSCVCISLKNIPHGQREVTLEVVPFEVSDEIPQCRVSTNKSLC